jgi:hypothetical protein
MLAGGNQQMKNATSITFVLCGAVVICVLAVVIVYYWQNWRKNGIIEAGKSLGFRPLAQGEKLPIVLVPLINRAGRKYIEILLGNLNGYETAFFDLEFSAGKDWFFQSTVMVNNPQMIMPMFQLKSHGYLWQMFTQRTCGDELKVPGREQDMKSLRLSGKDPQWAGQTFSRATPQFFEKLRKGKWTIEGTQHSLVIYSWGRTIYPRKMQEYVKQAAEIAAEMYSLCS